MTEIEEQPSEYDMLVKENTDKFIDFLHSEHMKRCPEEDPEHLVGVIMAEAFSTCLFYITRRYFPDGMPEEFLVRSMNFAMNATVQDLFESAHLVPLDNNKIN